MSCFLSSFPFRMEALRYTSEFRVCIAHAMPFRFLVSSSLFTANWFVILELSSRLVFSLQDARDGRLVKGHTLIKVKVSYLAIHRNYILIPCHFTTSHFIHIVYIYFIIRTIVWSTIYDFLHFTSHYVNVQSLFSHTFLIHSYFFIQNPTFLLFVKLMCTYNDIIFLFVSFVVNLNFVPIKIQSLRPWRR